MSDEGSDEPRNRFSPGDRACVQLTNTQASYLKFGTVYGVTTDTPRPRYWVKFDDGTEHKILSETQLEPASGIVESN